jgi:hypothetical protein
MMQRPAKHGVGHRIEIAAPAAAVWAVIADLDHWGEWNPLYVQASGKPVVGTRLDMTIALEGMKPQKAQATVVTVEPGRLLEYGIVNLGGLVKAFRFVEVEALGPDRCAVANYEIMSGAIGSLLARAVGGKVAKGLQAMNEALKAKLENA